MTLSELLSFFSIGNLNFSHLKRKKVYNFFRFISRTRNLFLMIEYYTKELNIYTNTHLFVYNFIIFYRR